MPSIRFLLVPALAALPLAAAPAAAQQPRPGEELVDRVVAVVGDTALLLSDVQIEMERLAASGVAVPTDPAGRDRFARQVVERKVDDLVLLVAAREAGTEAPPGELAARVEQAVNEVQQRFGSEQALREALAQSGQSLEDYRETLRQQYAADLVVATFIRSRMAQMREPAVTREEALALFEEQRERLGTRPATVSFEQVVVSPEPSDSARDAARAEAEQVLAELREGAEWDLLARRHSDDPSNAERGGDLGWFRQGTMVAPFDRVVFAMRAGQTSGIVETDFGFHIIRLERVRGPERKARHILVAPEVTEADVARARVRADSVASAVRGGADVQALAARYETPEDERLVREVPVDQLPPAYSGAFTGVAPGTVVGPFSFGPRPERPSFVVARVNERREAGSFSFEDVEERVRQRIREQKSVEQILEELRGSTYVQVRL